MAKRNIKFNLDFSVKDILLKFDIKQFDNAIINISTYLEGKVFNPIGNICKLYVSVGDEVFLQKSNIRTLENTVEIDLDKNIVSSHGKALGELELTDSNGVFTSTTFIFDINPKVGEGSTIPGEVEGFIAKHERLIKEFKEEFKSEYNKKLEDVQESINSNKSQLDHIESKNTEQDIRLKDIEKVNQVQDVYIQGLFSENKDGRLSIEGEGNSLKLEGSKEGLVDVEKVVGNTLVNMADKVNGGFSLTATGNHTYVRVSSRELVNNTVYSLILNVQDISFSSGYPKVRATKTSGSLNYEMANKLSRLENGLNVCTLTFSEDVKTLTVYADTSDAGVLSVNWCILLEGDYTSKPIPQEYFEGMKSTFEDGLVTQEMVDAGEEQVENLGKYKHVSKVRGKNLFGGNFYFKDFDWVNGIVSTNSSDWSISDKVYLDKGQYTISHNNPSHTGTNANYLYIILLTENGEYINLDSRLGMDNSRKTFNLDKGRYVRFYIKNPTIVDFQVEKNGTITSYEPYYESTKTVYLTSPLLKGDEIVEKEEGIYHYHKAKKLVLNGGEDEAWDLYTNANLLDTVCICIKLSNKMKADEYGLSKLICDKLVYVDSGYSINSQNISAYVNDSYDNNHIYINVDKKNLESANKEGCVDWLKSNPITVVYELAKPYYEKISDDKLILEMPNSATLSVDSVIPCSNIKATYTGNVPSIYALEETNANQDDLIDVSLMATDEMYMMLEPILEMIPQTMSITERTVSKMVDMYVAMVQRGLKTIEDVPARYRKEVQDILNKLEK